MTTDHFDQLDREQFQDMIASAAFRRLRERIASELERARALAERHDCSIKQVRVAQGAAGALRVVLGLPDQILIELKGKSK